MNSLISLVILLLIAIIGFTIVLGVGIPAVDATKDQSTFRDAEASAKLLDNAIRGVAADGKGAVRVLNLKQEFVSIPEEDALEFSMTAGIELIEHRTRRIAGGIAYISGNDVSCSESGQNMTMENALIAVNFQRVVKTTPYANIDTAGNILSMREKASGITVNIANSSIVVDDNQSSASGNGYSEILRTGVGLPVCTAHFYINSTSADYDIFYMLYSGADFLVMDVRNVA